MKHLTTRPRKGQGYTEWAAEWQTTLDNRTPFTSASALSGRRTPGQAFTGRMVPAEAARIRADFPCYVVYSYATPIAWVTNAGVWQHTTMTHSVTTARHCNLVARFCPQGTAAA